MRFVGLILSQRRTVSSSFTSYLLDFGPARNSSKSLFSLFLPITITHPSFKAVFLLANGGFGFNLGSLLGPICGVLSPFRQVLLEKEVICP
jgi:hypothetical protein